MREWLFKLFGEGSDLSLVHTCTRTLLLFFVALFLLRLGGIRILGKKSAFDELVAIMLGAVLSRGIVGASPLGMVIVSGLLMILLHRLVAWLSAKSTRVARIAEGRPVLLFEKGRFIESHLSSSCISKEEVLESLRLQTNSESFDEIEKAFLECNGRISFVMKKEMEKATH